MAENLSTKNTPTTPLAPEMLVPRLGDYLVQKGLITNEQLVEALQVQQERQKVQNRSLLGETLVELGHMERRTLDHAITELIIQLRNALEDANRNLEQRVRERTAELQEALHKLSELNQLKANFVANISHELRTPLTHIKGYLELFHASALGELTEEQKSAIEVSRRAATRLENLVDNLILFSVASRGEMTLKLNPIALENIIDQAVASPRTKAAEKGVEFNINIPASLPLLKADAEKLKWVLLQLLDNAVKFTDAGGSVTLLVRPEAGKLVMLSVVDTGIGISKDRLKELFEPFHQLDGSTTRRFGGTGMGLALARQIIEAHGSVIEVESEEGKGSTFRFPLLVAERPS